MNKQEVLSKFIYRKPNESTRPKLEAVNKAVLDVAEAYFVEGVDGQPAREFIAAHHNLCEALHANVPSGDDKTRAADFLVVACNDSLPLNERVQALQAVRMFANSGIVTADRNAESSDWCKEGQSRFSVPPAAAKNAELN